MVLGKQINKRMNKGARVQSISISEGVTPVKSFKGIPKNKRIETSDGRKSAFVFFVDLRTDAGIKQFKSFSLAEARKKFNQLKKKFPKARTFRDV